jgi:hypothetical protein
MIRYSDAMLEQLLKNLNSKDSAIRASADAEARALPPEQLLQLAELEARNYRRRMQWYKRIGLAYAVLVVFTLALMIETWITGHHFIGGGFFNLWWVFNALIAGLLPKHARRSVATIIEQTQDPRFIGPALTMLADNYTDGDVKYRAKIALRNLLPQLRADQTNTLTAEQRDAMLIPLKTPFDDLSLSLIILKALEQVGDGKAIPVVKKLTEGGPTRKMQTLKEAAEECLPFLEINAERIRQSQTLLRASDSIAVAPDTLLRPAMAHADSTPPEQLLRPTVTPE